MHTDTHNLSNLSNAPTIKAGSLADSFGLILAGLYGLLDHTNDDGTIGTARTQRAYECIFGMSIDECIAELHAVGDEYQQQPSC